MQLLKSIQMDIWRDGSVDGLVQIKTRHKSYKTAPFYYFFPHHSKMLIYTACHINTGPDYGHNR